MSDLCKPFAMCDDLDSRVLFQRSIYGPALITDLGSLPFGALELRGAAVRPYLDVYFEVRWVPRDLCLGPISSVMTLAPGETVTVATRTEHRTSFTDLVRRATDSSSVSTHTRQGQGGEFGQAPARPGLQDRPGGGGGGGGFGNLGGGNIGALLQGQVGPQNMGGGSGQQGPGTGRGAAGTQDVVELRPIYAKHYGSIWSDIGDAFLGVLTGGASLIAKGVAGAVSDHVNGGASGLVHSTNSAISEIIDSISRRESQSNLSEATHSTQDMTSTSVTRSFSNPYRDRTLQLRFMPVFRRFDSVVSVSRARVGLAMVCGHLDFSTTSVGSRYAHVLSAVLPEPSLMRLAQADIGVAAPDFHAGTGTLQDHLQANASVYTKSFLAATVQARDEETLHGAFHALIKRNSGTTRDSRGDISAGLVWSQSEVRANVIHVPLSDLNSVQSAWGLDPQTSARLGQAVSQLSPDRLGSILGEPQTQTLHLYAGSHIEPVPGECLLPNIVTDALKVTPTDTN